MPLLRSTARSDIGLGRYRNNQDSGYAGEHLLVVADGMGGHAGGDVASSLAVATLVGLDAEAHGPEALAHLAGAIAQAQGAIMEAVAADPALGGMGTTVTALLRSGDRLALAHIGDSRAYLLRDGALTQVTTDHTFVQMLVDEGRITAQEAENHPQRSVIMRVLGDVDAEVELDTSVRAAVVGDRWLLCSDGLSGPVSDETIAETMRERRELTACARELVDLALRAGGADNITCVVADVVEERGGTGEVPAGAAGPWVVGAAAVDRDRATSARGSAAARAAGLLPQADTQPVPVGGRDAEPAQDAAPEAAGARRGRPGGRRRRPGSRRPRIGRWLGAVVVVVVLLVAGGLAVNAWLDRQFYVGTARGRVAIYSGLPQDVGPVRLSHLVSVEDVTVDDLPPVYRERVGATIGARDLPHARRIAADLATSARPSPPTTGSPAPAAPTPAPSPTSTPATGATG